MFECDYIDGEWQTPSIKPYAPLLDPSARVFITVKLFFEGMKAYKDNDAVWLLDLMKITNDLIVLLPEAMPEVPEAIFMEGLNEVLKMDTDWIKKGRIHFILDLL
jgi:branched-chain amino acid aminotransferase